MRNPNARFNGLRKSQRGKIVAMRFHHQANGFTLVNVEHALFDQMRIDRRIKPTVVNNVVDVTISIVVHPSRGDETKSAVGTSG